MAKSNSMDSPVEKSQFKPGNATELPTKHYSQKDMEGAKGRHEVIEGPADEAGKEGMYHK